MKTKRVNRYYCDFCNKGGCSGGHMKKHEQRCCRNPNRICGFCATGQLTQRPVKEMIKEWCGTEDHLKEITKGCPACMLAVVLQSQPKHVDYSDPDDQPPFWYDFKTAASAWWADRNNASATSEETAIY